MTNAEQKLLKEGFRQTSSEELAGYADIDEAELALQMARRYAWILELVSTVNPGYYKEVLEQALKVDLSAYIDEQIEKESSE